MMRYVAIAMLAGLTACSFDWNDDKDGPGAAAAGSGTTRTYAVAGFDGIDLRGSDDIDVRVGSGFSIRAEGPSDQLDQLRIERRGTTLDVGRRNHVGLKWRSGTKVKVYVTLPRLAAANVAGSGDLTVDRVQGGVFTGAIAGSGRLVVATLAVDKANVSISGSGDVQLAGAARSLDVNVAGSGRLAGERLTAARASVSIAGSGDVRARVDGPADVNMMGSGSVDLGRGATCTVAKMGSGTVRCR